MFTFDEIETKLQKLDGYQENKDTKHLSNKCKD